MAEVSDIDTMDIDVDGGRPEVKSDSMEAEFDEYKMLLADFLKDPKLNLKPSRRKELLENLPKLGCVPEEFSLQDVMSLLSEKTEEYWEQVAKEQNITSFAWIAFVDALQQLKKRVKDRMPLFFTGAMLQSAKSIVDATATMNGVLFTDPLLLPRVATIQQVFDKFGEGSNIIVIRSPPATGKTGMLQLMERILHEKGYPCTRISLRGNTRGLTFDQFVLQQLGYTDLSNPVPPDLRNFERYILLDEAQETYRKADPNVFWGWLLKDIATRVNMRVVIAATYTLGGTLGSPDSLRGFPKISYDDMKLTPEEASTLWDKAVKLYAPERPWFAGRQLRQLVLDECAGHIGCLRVVISILRNEKELRTEKSVIVAYLANKMMDGLERCVTTQTGEGLLRIEDRPRELLKKIYLHGKQKVDNMESGDYKILLRAAIVTEVGKESHEYDFATPIIKRKLFRVVFPGSVTSVPPKDIDELIHNVVRRMSTSQLVGARRYDLEASEEKIEKLVPKEGAFQQMFYQGISECIPPNIYVAPEMSTKIKLLENVKTKKNDGTTEEKLEEVLHTGELDFFINSTLLWGIELVRAGVVGTVTEHLSRFTPNKGKYSMLGLKAWRVVDFRYQKRTEPKVDLDNVDNLVIVSFSPDFTSATIRTYLKPADKKQKAVMTQREVKLLA